MPPVHPVSVQGKGAVVNSWEVDDMKQSMIGAIGDDYIYIYVYMACMVYV